MKVSLIKMLKFVIENFLHFFIARWKKFFVMILYEYLDIIVNKQSCGRNEWNSKTFAYTAVEQQSS